MGVQTDAVLDMAKLVAQKICRDQIRVAIELTADITALGYAPKTKPRLITSLEVALRNE